MLNVSDNRNAYAIATPCIVPTTSTYVSGVDIHHSGVQMQSDPMRGATEVVRRT